VKTLNYENLSKITCQYKDENLGNVYKYKKKRKFFEKEFIDLNKSLVVNVKVGGNIKLFKNKKTRRELRGVQIEVVQIIYLFFISF
jgi:hypothetical protein